MSDKYVVEVTTPRGEKLLSVEVPQSVLLSRWLKSAAQDAPPAIGDLMVLMRRDALKHHQPVPGEHEGQVPEAVEDQRLRRYGPGTSYDSADVFLRDQPAVRAEGFNVAGPPSSSGISTGVETPEE